MLKTAFHSQRDWSGQVIFLRVDFNVPMSKGKISDDFKIRATVPDIKFLCAEGAKVILATHLGDPEKRSKELSTAPLVKRIARLSGCKVKFINDCIGKKVQLEIKKMKNGEVLLLENLRFNIGEKTNDLGFAKKLANLADVYINDAFAVCHRAQASVAAIKKFLPTYFGSLLAAEIKGMENILHPKQPLVVIMGGAKIETKAPIIKKLYPLANKILIGGALANVFLQAKGLKIGAAKFDHKSIKIAKALLLADKQHKIILPSDVVITNADIKSGKLKKHDFVRVKQINFKKNDLADNELPADIGPETISNFAKYIKRAKTIVWNGPMGVFEIDNLKHGTMIIARLVAARSAGKAFGLVGGGETVEAVGLSKMGHYIDWVSTGGGAMLSYLAGEKMPGLK